MSPAASRRRKPAPSTRLSGKARQAHAEQCGACRSTVLAGVDADVLAVDVRVDLMPLDAVGEALAQMAGRATFRLHWNGPELSRRESWSIAAHPAGSRDGPWWVDVRAEHLCSGGSAVPAGTAALQVHRAWVAFLNAKRDGWYAGGDEPQF